MKRRNYIDDPEKREKIEKLLPAGKKKWVRYDEGALLYSMGVHSFEDLASLTFSDALLRVNRGSGGLGAMPSNKQAASAISRGPACKNEK